MTAPWWAKIAGKLVLARIPLRYSIWSKIGVFRHGKMHNAAYAQEVWNIHYDRAKPRPGFVTLELGPGDALASAVLTKAYGGLRSIQVDVGRFASADPAVYRRLSEAVAGPDLSSAKTLDQVQEICGSTYMTEGLDSLRATPSASVDFIYSHSCLEHVRARDFLPTMIELRRILKPGGVASHWVDLQDHLGGRLNNLRFGAELWEADRFALKSGFYTNRLSCAEMIEAMRLAGFAVETPVIERWDVLPTAQAVMARPFRDEPPDQRLVRGFAAVCT